MTSNINWTITVFSKYLYVDFEYTCNSIVSAGGPLAPREALCSGERVGRKGRR